MILRLARTEPGTLAATWSVEAPTPGVVLIDIAVGRSTPPAPLHWRAGTWAKPPLDLSLDETGRPVALQFVLQDERIPTEQSSVLPDTEAGIPVFRVEDWPSERYCDETMPVASSRLSGGEFALRLGEARPLSRAWRLAPGLLMAFSEDDVLKEIHVGPLAEEDWEAIDAFSFVE